MPKFEQSFPANADEETMLAVSYEVFLTLKWVPAHAGNQRLMGEEQSPGNSKPRQIVVTYVNGNMLVSSETIHDQVFDMGGRNKKNVANFFTTYNNIRPAITEQQVKENIVLVDHIKAGTADAIRRHNQDAEEIEATMKMKSSNLFVTYTIIAINVLVFILMAMQGAGIMEANGLVHLKWGSNFAPLTLSGDWWRLFTNIFIHFGIIHLAMNMYALFMIGMYLEPMLGKIKFITAYICTGVIASLISLWWHDVPANSAGASGAIFGLYGLFLAMLTTDLIPASIRKSLLGNIGIFVLYNLAYGMKGGIDNSAHIGGLLSGLVIGYLYVFAIKKERLGEKLKWVLPLVIIATLGAAGAYLSEHKGSDTDRAEILKELKNANYNDTDRFNESYNEIITLQDSALAPLNRMTDIDEKGVKELMEQSMPRWKKAETIAISMSKMNVSEGSKKKLELMQKYIALREEEILLLEERLKDNSPENIARSTNIKNEMDNLVDGLQNAN